jgi:hypothetical protein
MRDPIRDSVKENAILTPTESTHQLVAACVGTDELELLMMED